MIKALGLTDWHILTMSDEFDIVGPIAPRTLLDHGVLFPANTFLHQPLIDAARGGALLTGMGGDQVLLSWRHQRLADVRARRRAPRLGDGVRYLAGSAPRRWRERLARLPRLDWWSPDWLRPEIRRDIVRLRAVEHASEPDRFDAWLPWLSRRRGLQMMTWSYEQLATSTDVRLVHPFLDPDFLASLVRLEPRDGLGDRTRAMQRIFGEVVPAATATRSTKAEFSKVFWTARSREFAQGWNGEGVDDDAVDVERLRRLWLSNESDSRSGMLMQRAWLAKNHREVIV